jgi:DNA helicase-2/ATP-dependent DNA helicase PcrA
VVDPYLTGRSVVVRPGQSAPPAWEACARVVVDGGSEALADRLLHAWRSRTPLVIELASGLGFDDPATPPPTVGPTDAQPWEWPVGLRLVEDEVHHGIWANSVDARAGTGDRPSYRWADAAVALGCTRAVDEVGAPGADVLLPDGTPAICDGGPLDVSLAERLGPDLAVVHRTGLEHRSIRALTATHDVAFPLAPDQLAAVTCSPVGARVIAPAGSGKTRVLTERARLLIEGWGVPAGAVALVAYNVRARDELQQRLVDLAGVRIRTLNALSLRLAGDVRTIDEPDARTHLARLVAIPRRADADPLAVWLEAMTRVRLGLRDPKEVEADLPDVAGLADIARSYRDQLSTQGEVDFDEQVVRAIARLLGDPVFRHNAQRSARVLLVDEFQDLTPAHLLLLRLLTGPAGAVFGVGDDDQTIYGYAGASPQWLVDFQRWFPGSAQHALEVNYRCAPAVVEAATNLLTRNAVRVPKRIRPRSDRSSTAGSLDVRAPSDDPARVSAEAVKTLVDRGTQPVEVAVLCRVNSQLAPVHVLLQHHGIPVRSPIDERFLKRSTVRAALAWCALSVAPERSAAWRRLDDAARRPRRGMSESLRGLAAKQKSVPDLQSLSTWLENKKGNIREADKIADLAADVEQVRSAAPAGTARVLRVLRDDIGLASSAAALDEWSHGSVSSHEDDLDALVALAHLQPDPSAFEPWLRDQLSKPPAEAGVTLASVHAVKGREWPYVVVHHVSEGLLPHRLVDDVEEERRVFHVAITRSSIDTIIVPGAKPSPLLAELRTPGAPPPARQQPAVGRGRSRAAAAPTKTAPVDDLDADQRALYEVLRAWRTGVIRGTNKPAYTVLTDATLAQIAVVRPADERALSRVPGIGPSKLEQYGDEILATVQAHGAAE